MNHFDNPLAPLSRKLPEKTRQLKAWVRALYNLDDRVVISVAELACRDVGCPDVETVIGIMRPAERVRTIRIHKSVEDIGFDDVRLSVMRGN
ncbi:nitrate reductase [Mangrovicella endophytica]|uniref:nitrate reductase n=1 Tax=Mangrovicella endophytica TaxID=2066697 RepID=UPI000C9EA941|nr:nitrate reductase [Mangrovicella endophytica]